MTSNVPLDKDTHRNLKVDPRPSEAYGDNIGMIGVVPREFARLVGHYPIFLRRTPTKDAFECGVVLGFGNTENLFLTGEGWDAHYVPLNIQRQPFAVFSRPEDGNLVVTVDMDSPRLSRETGEPLFLGDGEPSDHMKRITGALNEMVQGARIGFEYTAKLEELGLIEKVGIDLQFADGSKLKLDGLYSISREKLQGLAGEQLAELRNLGYLEWIYIQLASLVHMNALLARKNQRNAAPQPIPEAAPAKKRTRRAATA
jgi:hypothetical protein